MRDHAILMRERHPQGAPEIAVVPYGARHQRNGNRP